jgi:SNF2 family DNA or RNA helicase
MEKVLFTRQRHEAERAGLHFDYRLVVGGVAKSWATKKDLPKPGESIILWQQPDHTIDYALSPKVVIPKGMYGAGVTTLDWVKKGEAKMSEDKIVIHTNDGRFLLKKVPGYGEGDGWLFKNLGMEKVAEESKLKPHQERALEKLEKTHGLILSHSMGSGKTMTFLTALERAQAKDKNGRSLIIAPASLTSNIDKEIAKHKLKVNLSKVDVMSYEKATIDAEKLRKNKYILAISDEAHKLRNTNTQRHTELADIISNADNRILATATSSYNHVVDTAPLVNIASGGQEVLPEDKKAFEKQYVYKRIQSAPFLKRIFGAPSKEVSTLKNTAELKEKLNTYIDHYNIADDPEAMKHFPTKEEKTIEVEMSPTQNQFYKYMENRLPWHLRLKVRSGMPLSKKESAQLNAFSSGVRQVSNSISPFMPNLQEATPKIKKAVESVEQGLKEDKNFKGLVYSNYLGGGLADYSKELSKKGISHGVYTGSLNKQEKDDIISTYNSGKIKVLLVSSAGGEGLDLKGTKKVQILNPHFNKSKIDQVIGRAARYDSHIDLPPKERHVQVEYYHSIFPSGILGKSKSKSIDQYLSDNSDHKDELSKQMETLMKENNK